MAYSTRPPLMKVKISLFTSISSFPPNCSSLSPRVRLPPVSFLLSRYTEVVGYPVFENTLKKSTLQT